MDNKSADPRRSLIYLAGFMGCGKSTIGPILANVLGYAFVDIDRIIEQHAAKPVVDIFAQDGEERFRAFERQALEETKDLRQHVVSLGGGTISNEENFTLVKEHGLLVYLQLSPEEIYARVSHRADRPMLKDANGVMLTHNALMERITSLLAQRDVFYTRADLIVPADHRLGSTVDELVHRLRKYL